MRNIALFCAGLAVMGGVVSVHLWQELRAERELTAQQRSQIDDLRARPAFRPAGDNITFQPPPADFTPAPQQVQDQPQVVARSAGPQASGPAAAIPQFVLDEREKMKDPEYQKARLATTRISLQQSNPDLAGELGLTPEEATRLFDLLAESQIQTNSISAEIASLRANGADRDTAMEAVNRRQQEQIRARDQQLEEMLGSGRFAQWQEYETMRPVRQQVMQWGRSLEGMGMPLTAEQTRPLVAAFAAEQRRQIGEYQRLRGTNGPITEAEQRRLAGEQARLQAETSQRVIDAAGSHLSPQQREALQELLAQRMAQPLALPSALPAGR